MNDHNFTGRANQPPNVPSCDDPVSFTATNRDTKNPPSAQLLISLFHAEILCEFRPNVSVRMTSRRRRTNVARPIVFQSPITRVRNYVALHSESARRACCILRIIKISPDIYTYMYVHFVQQNAKQHTSARGSQESSVQVYH